jgi:hypothetical protein
VLRLSVITEIRDILALAASLVFLMELALKGTQQLAMGIFQATARGSMHPAATCFVDAAVARLSI